MLDLGLFYEIKIIELNFSLLFKLQKLKRRTHFTFPVLFYLQ